jgi:hypothetical protein
MMRWARLTWQVPDPGPFAETLATRLGVVARTGGGLVPNARTIDLGSAVLEVRPWMREGPMDDPRAAGRVVLEPVPGGELAPEDDAPPARTNGAGRTPPLRLVGLGWATVELDRAVDELGMWLGDPLAAAAGDPLLGAHARAYDAGGLPGDRVVLLEPSTEGRLAASLARDGEGPIALYLRPLTGLRGWLPAARARGVTLSSRRLGPLGSSVLITGGPASGPHLLIVDTPSSPRSRRVPRVPSRHE